MLEFKKDNLRALVALAPTLLLMAVFTFWPIINSFIMAFLEEYSFSGMPPQIHKYAWIAGGTFKGVGIGNFVQVFKEPDFWKALRSEERRVGKECRSLWSRYYYKRIG